MEDRKLAMSVASEGAEIQRILAHVRSLHPNWTLEMAVQEAVERFHADISRVQDPGFREYLIESGRL